MTNTISRPATVREAGEAAEEKHMKLHEYLEWLERELGPIPAGPAGYRQDPDNERRWLGPEIVRRNWIITPIWNASTGTHSVDVWLAKQVLSSEEAAQLAADLLAARPE